MRYINGIAATITLVVMPCLSHGAKHELLFLTPASNAEQQGFVRVINHSNSDGLVTLTGIDDSGQDSPDSATFTLEAGETKHFTSRDIESGNSSKGLNGSIGDGAGNWRLVFESDLDLEVLGYIRTPEGFLTSVHDSAAGYDTYHYIPIFNPGSNTNQASSLRIVNPGESAASIDIVASDDGNNNSGVRGEASFTLGAGESVHISSADLESGTVPGSASGGIGDGRGKWRLTLTADTSIAVIHLLTDPNGYLTNLSTTPASLLQVTGLYEGYFGTSEGAAEIYGAFMPSGKFYGFTPEDDVVFVGEYTHHADSVSVTYSATPELQLTSESGTAEATFRSRDRISGSYDIAGSSGTFALGYMPLSERPHGFAEIAGNYSGTESGVSVDGFVSSDGSFTASDSNLCNYSGTLNQVRPTLNLYNVEGSYNCLVLGSGDFTGAAAVVDQSIGDSRGLLFVLDASLTDLAFRLTK